MVPASIFPVQEVGLPIHTSTTGLPGAGGPDSWVELSSTIVPDDMALILAIGVVSAVSMNWIKLLFVAVVTIFRWLMIDVPAGST